MRQGSEDLIVIGAGSELDVAVAVAQQGLKTAIVEKGPLGGTCFNRGCIPSKMLVQSVDMIETIKRAHQFGIKVKGYDIDFPSIVKRVSDSIDHDAQKNERNLRSVDYPRLFKEECRFVGHKTLQVGEDTIRADKILIASGGRPSVPNLKRLIGSGFITSDEALRLRSEPEVLTIRGGYIAAELGHFFGSLGIEINIVHRHEFLLNREDFEIAGRFTEAFQNRYNVFTGFVPVEVAKQDNVSRPL